MCSGSSGISEINEISSFVCNGPSVRIVPYIKCLLGDAQATTGLHNLNCAEHTCAHMLGINGENRKSVAPGARSCDQIQAGVGRLHGAVVHSIVGYSTLYLDVSRLR